MNYGSEVLKKLIEKVKKMTSEEYDELFESVSERDDVQIILPKIKED